MEEIQIKTFEKMCIIHVGKVPEKEFRFHPKRRWRFDFAYPEQKVAIEIDGGIWKIGRHNNPSGYVKDMEKFNEAAKLGWRVLKFTPDKVNIVDTYDLIKKTIEYK